MKQRYKSIVLCIVFLLFSLNLHAASPVWKISKGDRHLFIGGTIHILSPADYPLPRVFEKAYYQSSAIVFETDAQRMQRPDFQKYTMEQLTNAKGTTLKSILSAKTHDDLSLFLQERGIPISQLEQLKPGLVCITLTIIELSRLGLMGTGVDEYFTIRAINDDRDRLFLETPEEQVAFIAAMGKGKEDRLIQYTLNDVKTLPQVIKTMKTAWRKGDMKALAQITIEPLASQFPQIHQALFTKRNAAWMPKIEKMLSTEKVEFILVGAGHLAGEDGILKQLEAKGYSVVQQ